MATAFFTADFALVIARRIELLCDDAAEREPDIEFLIVIPFYSSAAMPLPPPSWSPPDFLTADRELVIDRRIEFEADDLPCPLLADRDDDCDDFAIVFPCWCWIPVYD